LKSLNQYIIQFVGLSNGIHHFNFLVDNKFFDSISSDLINSGNVEINLQLEKNNNMLNLQFDFQGTVDSICDRCTVDYAVPVKGSEILIVKTAGETYEESDEIITLAKGSYELDLSQYIFDIVVLSLPLKIVPCELTNDTSICDKEVLKKISNLETEESESVDPRWEKLNQLKNGI
jgi:uncharacterized protein